MSKHQIVRNFCSHYDLLAESVQSENERQRISIVISLRYLLIDQHLKTCSSQCNIPIFFELSSSFEVFTVFESPNSTVKLYPILGTARKAVTFHEFMNFTLIKYENTSYTVKDIVDSFAYSDGLLHPTPALNKKRLNVLVETQQHRELSISLLNELSMIVIESCKIVRSIYGAGKLNLKQPLYDRQPYIASDGIRSAIEFSDGRHLYGGLLADLSKGIYIGITFCISRQQIEYDNKITLFEISSGLPDSPILSFFYLLDTGELTLLLTSRNEIVYGVSKINVDLYKYNFAMTSIKTEENVVKMQLSCGSAIDATDAPFDRTGFIQEIYGKIVFGANRKGIGQGRWQMDSFVRTEKPLTQFEIDNVEANLKNINQIHWIDRKIDGAFISQLSQQAT